MIRKRDVELAAADEAKRLGIVVEWCGKNKHWNLIVIVGNRQRKIGISCTPKDGSNLCNWVRQDIRKCYRELML